MNTVRIGIATYAEIKARTLRIARGEYKPGPDDPKIWFNSILSVARVLSERNQELLQTINRERPKSLQELSKLTGRETPNLSRTLHTLEKHGLVKLERGKQNAVRPHALAANFVLNLSILSGDQQAKAKLTTKKKKSTAAA